MAWSFVGVSAAVTVTATGHTLTEPAGVLPGDLLVAVISSRIASTVSITLPAGWALVAESKTNNVVAAATTSEASGMMAYIVRGASAPALTFTHPTAPSVAMGRIVAYRGQAPLPFDVGIGAKTGTAITAVSTTGLTTGSANELIVRGVCSGRASAFSAFDAATDPTTSSGTGSVDAAAPTVGTWRERQDSSTTTGADTALAIADAIRGTAGATGALTCTASVSGGHAQVAGAFKIGVPATAGSSGITQTGSVLQFSAVAGNSGTVSSTITVPSDADIVVVGVLGRDAVGDYIASMTFTKGGADTAMTRVAPAGGAGGQQPAIFYLALPDKGTNKSLKFDWAGSAAPAAGTLPTVSVTFWKGVDTASPVRSSGSQGEVIQPFGAVTGTLTALDGDLVVAMVGGYSYPGPTEGTVDAWYNLNALSQWTLSVPHDAAWGTFAPSGNLAVGALAASTIDYGVCAAIVLKPAPSPFKAFAYNSGSSSTVNVTVPATIAGDCIIVAGSANSVNPTIQTAGGQSAVFGTLGGMTSPRYSSNRANYDFVGIISNPAVGTTTVTLTSTAGNNEFGCWVVGGLTNPVQDKGIWNPNQINNPVISGLTGALAVADEYAVSYGNVENTVTGANTGVTGGSGFVFDGVTSPFGSGFSHKLTAATTQIQSAFNTDVGGGAVVLATYRSTPPAAPTPPPISLVGFASSVASSTTVTTTAFPATQAGDCIVFAGVVNSGDTAGIEVKTNNNNIGRIGKLNAGIPSDGGASISFVGVIPSPTVGSTSVTLSVTNSQLIKIAAWVVRGMPTPVQDKGVWAVLAAEPVSVSGLTGTLSTANEFAVSVARPPNWVGAVNVDQTGSGGFLLDTLSSSFDGGFSHQITEATTSIQAAWDSSTGGADVAVGTYRSGATTAGTSAIAQTGSALNFSISSAANSGTVSSTITVPADAQMVCVGLKGWCGEANFFTSMTFTKGAADVAMTRVGQVENGNGHTAAIFYLVLPDTGTNKSLKFDWAGTNGPGEAPLASVTFWKGIDTASPVRSTGASIEGKYLTQFACQTENILTALDGDRVIAFAGGDNPGSDGTVDSWLNLNLLTQCTKSADRHDGAWATYSPSGDLYVGALTSTGMTYGVISAIVLKPVAGLPPVTGTMAAPETVDAFASTGGLVRWQATLAVTETVDVFASPGGLVRWQATLAAPETVDVAAVNAAVRWAATLTTTEAADQAAFLGNVARIANLATTEGADVAAFTGNVFTPVTGTLDADETADVAAITATVVSPATGDLATREDADSAAFLGSGNAFGPLATIEAPDVAALLGTTRWLATLATVEAPDVALINGTTRWLATLATTEALDTAALTSTVRWSAALATTEAPDVAAFTGTARWQATLATIEAPDVGAFTGTIRWAATLATTEAADAVSFLGGIFGAGALVTTEAPDGAAFTGTAVTLGTLGAIEPADTAAFLGGIYGAGNLFVIEAADTYAGFGTVGDALSALLSTREAADGVAFTGQITGVAGTLATTEAPDLAALTASVRWAAILAASELPDVAAFTGTVRNLATLAVTEAPDVAAFVGQFVSTGTLATREAADSASFTSDIVNTGPLVTVEPPDAATILGTTRWLATLAATEAPDIAALTATVRSLGTLATTEAPDAFAFSGQLGLAGTLATGEAPDLAAFTAAIISSGILDTTEAPDVAAFTSAPVDIAEVPGRILASAQRRVRELASHEPRLRTLAPTHPPTRDLARAAKRVRSLKYPIPRTHILIKMLNTQTTGE